MLSIIIPTYNEAKNILSTIKNVQKNIPNETEYEFIIVDDDSPDLTWKVVQELNDKRVKCIRRKGERGLSSAVVKGFNEAEGDTLLVLDGDGQHDEKIIPEMLKYSKMYDIVIGSRFVKGGSIKGWQNNRKIQSKIASFLANLVITQKVYDPLSGYFIFKKKQYLKIRRKLECIGYKILLDIIYNSRNISIKEIPFFFKTRKHGKSKLGLKVSVEYLIMIGKFGFRRIFKKII